MTYDADQIGKLVAKRLSGKAGIIAALLMGSCARGEETYFINKDGNRELLSDYEMLVIIQKGTETSIIDEDLRSLANELKEQSSSPCFEVEWSYKTTEEIQRLDKRFIFFEAKESAKVVYGDDCVLSLFPKITISNLNFSELNTVIIHRLYHVLKDRLNPDEHYQKYLIARNTLDVPTAALPLMGMLESSYEKRNRLFLDKVDKSEFPEGIEDRLQDYLEMKKNYSSNIYEKYSEDSMRFDFSRDMEALYNFQKRHQKGHAFRRSYRLLLSAVYRKNLEFAYRYLHWEDLCEKLYSDMIAMLNDSNIMEEQIDSISNRMFLLFGYK